MSSRAAATPQDPAHIADVDVDGSTKGDRSECDQATDSGLETKCSESTEDVLSTELAVESVRAKENDEQGATKEVAEDVADSRAPSPLSSSGVSSPGTNTSDIVANLDELSASQRDEATLNNSNEELISVSRKLSVTSPNMDDLDRKIAAPNNITVSYDCINNQQTYLNTNKSLATSTVSLNETIHSNVTINKSPYSRSAENISVDAKMDQHHDKDAILSQFKSQKSKVSATQVIAPDPQANTNLDVRYTRLPKELLSQDLGSIVKNVHGIFSSVSGSLKSAYTHRTGHIPYMKTVKAMPNGKVMNDIFEDEQAYEKITNGVDNPKTEPISNNVVDETLNQPNLEDGDAKGDVLRLQVESLERVLAEQRKENTVLRERVKQQAEELQERDHTFRELETKMDMMSKRVEQAEREKDAAVMRYAGTERGAIEARRAAEQAALRERAATAEAELAASKLRAAREDKQRICQLYDDKCHELSTSERELAKVREDGKELEGRLKWTQSKLRMEMDAYKVRNLQCHELLTSERELAKVREDGKELEGRLKWTQSKLRMEMDAYKVSNLQCHELSTSERELAKVREDGKELEGRLKWTQSKLRMAMDAYKVRNLQCHELSTSERELAKVREDGKELEGRLKWTQSKLRMEMDAYKVSNLQCHELSTSERQLAKVREDGKELEGRLKWTQSKLRMEMDAYKVSNLQCHELSTSERQLAKVREDGKELEGRLKWTQSKLRMEMNAYKVSNLQCQELSTSERELAKVREDGKELEGRLKWTQSKLRMEMDAYKVSNLQCHELSTSERQLAKVREDGKELEGRLKWTQSKLRMEMDAYKDSAEKVDKLAAQVAALEAAAAGACDSQAAKQLETDLKESQAALILCRHERDSLERRLAASERQLEAATLQRDHAAASDANSVAEVERLRAHNARLEEEAAELAALRAQAALADTLGAQLHRETERAAAAEEALGRERARAETCARREAAALEHAARLTARHVASKQQRQHTDHQTQALSADNVALRERVTELEAEAAKLKAALADEAERRHKESRVLARKVAELQEETAEAAKQLEWEKGENGVLKKKHASQVKELNRELQRAMKRLELLEAKQPPTQPSTRTGSVTSLSSGESAPTEDRVNGHDTLPDIQVREPDRQALVERIVSLQRAAARRAERCEFLEEHARQLTTELRGKSRLLRHLLPNLPAQALASTASDSNKKEIASLGGGAMAALWGGDPGGLSLELSIEMNKRLQSVLEDTLLKNITLKENMDTLGEEIARLKGQKNPPNAK